MAKQLLSYEDWWNTLIIENHSKYAPRMSFTMAINTGKRRIISQKNSCTKPSKIAYYEGLLEYIDKRYEVYKVEELLQCT